MKKRRILLGLFMAAGAALSLAACDNADNNSGTEEVVTTKYTVTFNTNGGSAIDNLIVESGKKATKPADPTKEGFTFDGWYSDEALATAFNFDTAITANTTLYAKWTAAAVSNKFTVTYMDDTTELTALKQEVEENANATKPTNVPTKEGKRFVYWADDAVLETAFDFTQPITKNKTLYAIYKDVTEYDTMKAKTTNLVAADFYLDNSAVSLPDEGVTVTSDNKLKLTKANVEINHNTVESTGVYELYCEVTPVDVVSGEAWLQIQGTSAAKAEKTEVFGIRAAKNGSDVVFAYRLDGGSDIKSSVVFNKATTYKVKITLDTAEGKASYSVDGTVIANDINISIATIAGAKLTCKSAGTSAKVFDDVAINFETKQIDPVVAARAAAVKKITDYKATEAYTGLDSVVKTYVDAEFTELTASVAAAETEDAITTLATKIQNIIAAEKGVATIQACTAASTPVADLKEYVVFVGSVNADTIQTQYDAVKFAGYTIQGIYTDAALTTAATIADVVKGATLYAKVSTASLAGSWSAEDEALNQEAIADGTVLTSIVKTSGTVTAKYNSAKDKCIGFEIKQNNNGSLVVEVPTGQTVTVTFLLRSTSGTNKSDGIALYNGETVVVPTTFTPDSSDTTSTNTNGVMLVYGTKDTTVTYTLTAGTYTLKNNASTDNNRGFRVYGVTVAQ